MISSPAAFGRGSRVKRLASDLARALRLPNAWELEVAAMFAQVGAITLPQATAEKLYSGRPLDESEAAMVARVPDVTRDLIGKIPRLDGVLDILDKSRQLDVLDMTDPSAVGAQVLRIARDYDTLESEGVTTAVAVGAMRSRTTYDRRLIDVFADVVGVVRTTPVVREVRLADVGLDTTFASDVESVTGTLLVARGRQLTTQLRERLRNLGPDVVRQPLGIFVSESGT